VKLTIFVKTVGFEIAKFDKTFLLSFTCFEYIAPINFEYVVQFSLAEILILAFHNLLKSLFFLFLPT